MSMPGARFTCALAASLALFAATAHADEWVESSSISSGPHWRFQETPAGRVNVSRGDAGTFVVGRDRFTPDGRSALMVEAHLGGVVGGRGRTQHAGGSFGLKVRNAHRVELGIALAAFYHFDPRHLTDGTTSPGAVAQLAYDLDGGDPFTTRIILRAELQRPTPTTMTLDTFIGVGTRWP